VDRPGGRRRALSRVGSPRVVVPLAAGVGALALAGGSLLVDLPLVAAALAAGGAFLTTWASVKAMQPDPVPTVPPGHGTDGPMWRLPQRLHQFTGRHRDIDRLAATLTRGRRPDLVVLTGIGGVGKSSLALEYAHRVLPGVALAAWIPAVDRTSVVAALVGIGADLDVTAADPQTAARRALEHLHLREPWLLIYDDATPASVDGLLPSTGAGRIIVTSRRDDWSHWAETQIVEPFPEADAVTLLLHRSGDTSSDGVTHAAALAEALGHLPLAVDMAGGYCRRYRVGLATYRAMWQERGLALIRAVEGQVAGANEVVARLSADRLSHGDAAAFQLRRLLSMFAPGYLPQDVVQAHPDLLPDALAEAASDPVRWSNLLARVADAGLIRVEPDRLWTHQLVQQVQRETLGERGDPRWQRIRWIIRRTDRTAAWAADRWAALAARLLTPHFPSGLGRREVPLRCDELLPHAFAVLGFAERYGAPPLDRAYLAHGVATYLYQTGEFDAAADLHLQVIEASRPAPGEHHLLTLAAMNNLALAWQAQGYLDAAADLHLRVLETSQRTLGEDHPITAAAKDNLARVQQARATIP
jgi:hypothetical protein